MRSKRTTSLDKRPLLLRDPLHQQYSQQRQQPTTTLTSLILDSPATQRTQRPQRNHLSPAASLCITRSVNLFTTILSDSLHQSLASHLPILLSTMASFKVPYLPQMKFRDELIQTAVSRIPLLSTPHPTLHMHIRAHSLPAHLASRVTVSHSAPSPPQARVS